MHICDQILVRTTNISKGNFSTSTLAFQHSYIVSATLPYYLWPSMYSLFAFIWFGWYQVQQYMMIWEVQIGYITAFCLILFKVPSFNKWWREAERNYFFKINFKWFQNLTLLRVAQTDSNTGWHAACTCGWIATQDTLQYLNYLQRAFCGLLVLLLLVGRS